MVVLFVVKYIGDLTPIFKLVIEPRTKRSFDKFTFGAFKLIALFDCKFITDVDVVLNGVKTNIRTFFH